MKRSTSKCLFVTTPHNLINLYQIRRIAIAVVGKRKNAPAIPDETKVKLDE